MPKTTRKRALDWRSRSGRPAKRRRTPYKAMVPRPLPTSSGVPQSMTVKMRYCQNVILTGNAGAIGENLFSTNSIYDPDVSGVGHQPYGHDEWSTFMTYYTVRRSWISVDFNSTAEVPAVAFILRTDSTAAGGSSASRYTEAPGCVYSSMAGDQGGPSKLTLKNNYNMARDTGNGAGSNDDAFKGQFGASPPDQQYWRVGVQAIDASSTVSIPCYVTITYECELTVPKTLVQS